MSGTPWMYFCPYQEDITKTLQELKRREFVAGRYYPISTDHWLHLPIRPDSPAPGAKHRSIEEALSASGTGTQSILDMQFVSNTPQLLAVSPIEEEDLNLYFNSNHPTHEMIASNLDFFDEIEAGQGRYAVVYRDGVPDEIMFAGYSFD